MLRMESLSLWVAIVTAATTACGSNEGDAAAGTGASGAIGGAGGSGGAPGGSGGTATGGSGGTATGGSGGAAGSGIGGTGGSSGGAAGATTGGTGGSGGGTGGASGSTGVCSHCFLTSSFLTSEGWNNDIVPSGPNCTGFTELGNNQTGINEMGAWNADPGDQCDRVTSAANFSGGPGGRGFEHRIGDGHNNNGGSIFISFGDVLPQNRIPEFWARFYTAWEPGLVWGFPGNSGNQKIIYLSGTACGSSVAGCYMLLTLNSWSLTVAGTSSPAGSTWGWTQMNGGVNSADGAWRCIEMHFKNESTNSANDGQVEVWVDGVQRFSNSAVDFKGSDGFAGFALPENANVTTIGGNPMWNRFDEIAVSQTQKIGCPY